MTSIAVSELRANLMKILDQIKQGAQIQITSHGKVVARLVTAEEAQSRAKNELQIISDTAVFKDILSPISHSLSGEQSIKRHLSLLV